MEKKAKTAPITIFAIGDIHGEYQGMMDLLEKIATHPGNRKMVVFTGDYVGHGPNSAKVLDYLVGQEGRFERVLLKGDHDHALEMLLTGLEGMSRERYEQLEDLCWEPTTATEMEVRRLMRMAMAMDSKTALSSYAEWPLTAQPVAHLKLLKGLIKSFRVGRLFFSHAGVNPENEATEQYPEHLIWGHRGFREFDWVENLVAVHGHYPSHVPDIGERRVGLDTGAGIGGYLTAGVFEDGQLVDLITQWNADYIPSHDQLMLKRNQGMILGKWAAKARTHP